MNLKWDQIYGETAVERGEKRNVAVALFVWEMRWNEKRFFRYMYAGGREFCAFFWLVVVSLSSFVVFTLSSTPGKVKSGGGRVSAFPETSATVFPYFFGPKIKEYQCVL